MDNIFGLSMTSIMIVTLAIMGLCLLTTLVIAWRNPVIFRMAIRNVPRRKAQTILIMVGLMLSTLIIASSLTTGDTLAYSFTKTTYDGLGQVDETIAFVGDNSDPDNQGQLSTSNTPFDASVVEQLENDPRVKGNDAIQGFLPMLTIDIPAINPANNFNESAVVMTGLDTSRLARFGGLKDINGRDIALGQLPAPRGDLGGPCANGAAPTSAVISKSLADNLEAGPGDTVTFYLHDQPCQLQVAAVAKDSILTGLNVSGESADQNGIAVPLGWLQQLTGLAGQARFIAVSNSGGVESGNDQTSSVEPVLNQAVRALPGDLRTKLGVNPIKDDAIKGAELGGNIFMSFFIVLGLFSVAAGILLIFLIFMMLAAERRAEMGMARAVGLKRRHLIQEFIAEGTAYDLGAALIGAAVGVGVAFVIAGVMGRLVGQFVAITPHASIRSLVVAYSLGVTVTFITILFASIRSSRLNIVQAIRDLPEHQINQRLKPRRRGWWPWSVLNYARRIYGYYIGWWPTIMLLLSAFVLLPVGADKNNAFLYTLGISLIGLGLALLLRRWLPSRLVYTLVAVLELFYWLAPSRWLDWLFPSLNGGFEMFFLSGIMMVTFATLLIMWNAEAITWLIAQAGRLSSRWLPAIKTAVAYPLAAKGRTGLTIAMFAMVVFSLVTITTISANFSGLFSSDEATAGYDVAVIANPANPAPDIKQALRDANSSVDVSDIQDVAHVQTTLPFNAQVRNAGQQDWDRYTIQGVDQGYLQHAVTNIPLQARAAGYASDADVWNAMQSDPNLAVIDAVATQGGDFGSDPNAFTIEGYTAVDKVFQPAKIQIQNPSAGQLQGFTIIGVIDSKVSTQTGLFIGQQSYARLFPTPNLETIALQLRNSDTQHTKDVAKQIKADLIAKGVNAISIKEQIEKGSSLANGFLKLLEGFMGLGLLVGIAALGVISFRAVVERRQQIGMLRAIGYQKNMVATSFLLESLVTAVLGIGAGTILALILSWNLITSGDVSEGTDFSGFVVPWGTIAFFIIAALVAAALMTWIPSRKASSVPIAEALRYE